MSTGLIHHNLVVKVRYCRHLLKQSGSQASHWPKWNPHTSVPFTWATDLSIQCHCADWMVSGPMYKPCTITGEEWGGAQNLAGNLSYDSFGLFDNTSTSQSYLKLPSAVYQSEWKWQSIWAIMYWVPTLKDNSGSIKLGSYFHIVSLSGIICALVVNWFELRLKITA